MSNSIPDTVENLGRFSGEAKRKAPTSTRLDPPKVPASSTPASTSEGSSAKCVQVDHENALDHADSLPQVRGFRILLVPVKHKETTDGGIVIPKRVLDDQVHHAQIFRVIGMGPAAYQDDQRFPDGPYCEKGDYVYIARYAGTRISTMYCDDLRIVNDDEVMAVVPDVDSTLDLV